MSRKLLALVAGGALAVAAADGQDGAVKDQPAVVPMAGKAVVNPASREALYKALVQVLAAEGTEKKVLAEAFRMQLELVRAEKVSAAARAELDAAVAAARKELGVRAECELGTELVFRCPEGLKK